MGDDYINSDVYYKDRYWNDHRLVLNYMERSIKASSSSELRWWVDHFVQRYGNGRPFERALILNCGNGWVEREFIDKGIIRSGVGFDYSSVLLTGALQEAGKRDLSYVLADCNAVQFAPNSFDLIINVAALHHVQYIDRLLRSLLTFLRPEGYFVNFDYVGPHRNQYGERLMEIMHRVNNKLPAQLACGHLGHPDLQTMLATDPTEAIHSELIHETFEQYFHLLERKDLNGGVAYQIMHNNEALFSQELPEAETAVKFLVDVDKILTAAGVVPTLFSFFVGQPNKAVLQDTELLKIRTAMEESRERQAKQAAGRYYVGK